MNLKNGFAYAFAVAAMISLTAGLASLANEPFAPTTQSGQPVTPIPEIPAPSAAFIKLDRDKDGKLDPGEFALFENPPSANPEPKPPDNQKSLDKLKNNTPPVM